MKFTDSKYHWIKRRHIATYHYLQRFNNSCPYHNGINTLMRHSAMRA